MSAAVVQLGEVADFVNGYAFKPEDWTADGLPIIRIQNLTGNGTTVNRTNLQVPAKFLVRRGDLLVSWSASLGVFRWDGPEAIVNQHIFKVIPNLRKVDLDYLRHAIDSSIHEMERFTHGSTMKHINRKEFLEHRVPLPPLDEQRRIAAILDKADTLRRKRKRAIKLIDSLTQSAFQEMFGDGDYPLQKLEETVKKGTIVTYGIVQAGPEFPGGVPYIRTGDIVDGTIEIANLRRTDPAIAARFSRSRVEAGDIVMSIRATVGTTAVVPFELEGANLTQGTARIAPGESVHVDYLLEYIRSSTVQRWLKAQVKGATFLEITLGRLRELPVAIPPVEKQLEFARKVEKIRQCLRSLTRQSSVADGFFSSLQHRGFSGQL